MTKLNVLITSISKKISLVRAVRHALNKISSGSIVIGADCDPSCVGRYFVDQFWEMPKLDEFTLNELLKFCRKHKVSHIIPTRDGELLFFSKIKEELASENISVMVSNENEIALALDKLKFYQTLKVCSLPVVTTTLHSDDLDTESFVVKERFGSGSSKIGVDLTKDEAETLSKVMIDPLFQPYVSGEEISVDLYIDGKGKVKGVICRTRDLIVNGESQITTSFRDEVLEGICVKTAEMIGLYGHVMFQLIRTNEGDLFLECNPRFGGASILSIEMGLDSICWFLNESKKNLDDYSFKRAACEKKLVRYPEDKFYDQV